MFCECLMSVVQKPSRFEMVESSASDDQPRSGSAIPVQRCAPVAPWLSIDSPPCQTLQDGARAQC